MATYQIPVTNTPQRFDISLGGVDYTLVCKWNNSQDAGWVLDIYEVASGAAIVANVPLITGADCLSGLEYLGINGKLIVRTDGDETAVPTYENLGVESFLYFETSN